MSKAAAPPALVWLQALMALAVLLFVPGLQERFEPAKVAVVRLFGWTFLAAAIATWAASRRVGTPARWNAIDVAVACWVGVEVASTLTSSAPILSLVGEPVQREGLVTSLALVGAYAAARSVARSAPALAAAAIADATLAAGSLAALAAVMQAVGHDPFGFGPSYRFGAHGTARAFGTLGHPNLLGAFAAGASALALGAVVRTRRLRWVSVLGLLLVATACLVTFSRGAWLGWLAGMLVAAVLLARGGRIAAGATLAVLLLTGATFTGATFTGASGWQTFVARLADLSPTSGTGATRVEIWRSALDMWRAHPLLGVGPDAFALAFPHHQTPRYWTLEWAGLPVHAHSIVLHTLATRGLFGIAAATAWALALAATWWSAWRAGAELRPWLAGAAGALVALMVAGLFGALGITGALLVVVLSGWLAGVTQAPAPAGGTRGGARTVVMVVAVLATVWTLASLVAARTAWQAETALERVRVDPNVAADERERVAASAARATALAPYDDRNHRVRCDALLGTAPFAADPRERLAAALDAAHQALAIAPTRAENHEQGARVLTARALLGDTASVTAAERAIDRMARLAPANALLLDEAARLELVLGRGERARNLAERVVTLYPRDSPAWLTLSAAEVAMGDSAAARASLGRAEDGDWHGNEAARRSSQEWLERWR